MTRFTPAKIVALLCVLLAAAGSVVFSVQMASVASRNKLAYTDRVEEGQPPEVALGIALGAFRGVFVNFLWIRANDLKQEGKFFELNQLAEAITRLQPRFPRVWVFHAWNMAYNISVSTQTRAERWYWVQKGIQLLRNKGIVANPNDMLLHKELAWIFLHKIGGITDDANRYYKMKLAEEWTTVLGQPPARDFKDRSREHAIEQTVAFLQPIADAPRDLSAVIEKTPSVQTLLDRIVADVGDHGAIGSDSQANAENVMTLLRRYELIQAVLRSSSGKIAEASMSARMKAMLALVRDPALKSAWDAYLPFARRYILETSYNMEPGQMIRFVRKYGPIDWRVPASHALYWSAQGVERGLLRATARSEKDFDFTNTDRIVIQAVQDLYRYGQIYFDYLGFNVGAAEMYLEIPDPSFAQTYADIMQELVGRSKWDTADRAYTMYAAGYENFFTDVILYFYRLGMKDVAEKYYRHLATWGGMNLNDPDRPRKFSVPLEDFVQAQLADRQRSPNVAVSEVTASLIGAFTALLAGDDEQFRSQMDYAAQSHAYFMKNQRNASAVDTANARMDIMEPDFRIQAGATFVQFMSMLGLDEAAAVFKAAPDDLRRFAYDLVVERFRDPQDKSLAVNGERFDNLFVEPPGMAEHRAMIEDYRKRKSRQNVQELEQK
ncbi:MAG: hypothetical protein KF691_13485 [Phycisphaeraceae bacterium]|nr:hypothetical protein [Phycisphaeraceae bacterium]